MCLSGVSFEAGVTGYSRNVWVLRPCLCNNDIYLHEGQFVQKLR